MSTTPNSGILPKPRLSLAQIFLMSTGFLGIQFGFALQNGNASRILRSYGADVEHLPMFWIVAPLVGMIVQPIIGHYSDKTWNRLGRLWIGAGIVMIMDASFNVAMEPFRALVADNLPVDQSTTGFSIQTFLIGLGAVGGSALPELLAKNGFSMQAASDGIADNIRYSFYIGAAVFIVAILITVLFSKEYAPKEYAQYHGKQADETSSGLSDIFKDFSKMPKTMRQLGLVQFFSWFALFSMWVFTTDAVATHVYGLTGDYTNSILYNEAGNKVSSAFGVYNLVAMF